MFLYAFEESVDCHLLSSFCDDSNLHISLFKYVLSTMGVSKESISKFLIGNRFHVKSCILSLYSNRIILFESGLRMRNFTWIRCPIKNLLIDSLLTPIVESTYLTWHESQFLITRHDLRQIKKRCCENSNRVLFYPNDSIAARLVV